MNRNVLKGGAVVIALAFLLSACGKDDKKPAKPAQPAAEAKKETKLPAVPAGKSSDPKNPAAPIKASHERKELIKTLHLSFHTQKALRAQGINPAHVRAQLVNYYDTEKHLSWPALEFADVATGSTEEAKPFYVFQANMFTDDGTVGADGKSRTGYLITDTIYTMHTKTKEQNVRMGNVYLEGDDSVLNFCSDTTYGSEKPWDCFIRKSMDAKASSNQFDVFGWLDTGHSEVQYK